MAQEKASARRPDLNAGPSLTCVTYMCRLRVLSSITYRSITYMFNVSLRPVGALVIATQRN